jgi:acetyl-CoA carboxylase biotin carboxylase subunit
MHRILIANRGEIAVRIIRTCKVLGLKTILVVSEADLDSLGARLADKVVVIGPPAASTYLNIPTLIKAAFYAGADAIHPGYGFLSENPEFAQVCVDRGLIFIGPTPAHLRRMGNKLEARAIAKQQGVPILDGSEQIHTPEEALSAVKRIGFPVMIKAAAGGGGRGMTILTEGGPKEITEAFLRAAAESGAAFGDSTLYAEKYIAHARQIEVQILGDKHGNVIHLGERDCSTQRRHQKLIEESGAPCISETLRNGLQSDAVKLAKSLSYENAGTVEFLVDPDEGKYYFLEMNTRIQVEHPVTELVTGVDLVEEQIRIADGEPLSRKQQDVRFSGHAIECRINAEQPEEGFRPTPGLISAWQAPLGPGIRVDTHCYPGYRIPIFYDSLIAKVIAHGSDRDHALARLTAALDEFSIGGITTTCSFLRDVLRRTDFASGKVHTRILEM